MKICNNFLNYLLAIKKKEGTETEKAIKCLSLYFKDIIRIGRSEASLLFNFF